MSTARSASPEYELHGTRCRFAGSGILICVFVLQAEAVSQKKKKKKLQCVTSFNQQPKC